MDPFSNFLDENIFRLILDNLAEGIQFIGFDWRYLYINKTAAAQHRRNIEELLGKTVLQCYPELESTRLYAELQGCMNDRSARAFEFQNTITGQNNWYELRITPLLEGILILSFDITERKKSERALRESEERFANAFRSSPAGIAISRAADGRFVDVNDEACRIYGYKREEVIGRTSIELGIIQAESRQKLVDMLQHQHSLRNVEINLGTGTGEQRSVLFSWEPIHINDEECLLATIIDITERQKMIEQQFRMQRLESIGSVAAGIVHDMNNILGPIMMSLGRLRKNLINPDDRKMIDMLENNSRRAAELMKQILTFTRGSESSRSSLKVSLVLDEVVKLLKPTFSAKITFEVNLPKSLWMISGDATQIHQILVNLAVNARDAMPQGGTLSFAGENFSISEADARLYEGAEPGLYVLLRVTDSGTGMTPEVKSRIFDQFFSTKESGKGTGLGLSTVSTIVKAHHGFIDVESKPGEGTTFKIYLPAVESMEAVQEQREVLEAMQGNNELILLVDDDAIVREIAMISLEANGYRVVTAVDGNDAIVRYAQHAGNVRLVITDMDMPIMDGAAFVRALRTINTSIPVIGSSGTADKPRLAKLETSGINGFLPKPYTTEILLKTIHDALYP